MKRVPSLWLAERLMIADIENGERLWAFIDAILVDTEGTVWVNRLYAAHGRRLPEWSRSGVTESNCMSEYPGNDTAFGSRPI